MKTADWTATTQIVESPLPTSKISMLYVIVTKSFTTWPIYLFLTTKDGFHLTGSRKSTIRGTDKSCPRSYSAHMTSCKALRFSSTRYWSTAQTAGTGHHSWVRSLNFCLILTTEHSKASKCWLRKTGAHLVTCLQNDVVNSVGEIWKTDHKFSFNFLTVSTNSGIKWAVSLSSVTDYSRS